MRNVQLDIKNKTLEEEDFSRLRLTQFTATDSRFMRCKFDGSRIDRACFGAGVKPSEYVDCTFDGCRFRAMAPGNARFVRCSFKDCVILEFFGMTTEFIDCVFSGEIRKAVFRGSILAENQQLFGRVRNEFSGNDFSEARLCDVAFRGGIDLANQRLPSGEGYLYICDAAASLESVRRKIIRNKDLAIRSTVLALLKGLESDAEGGQTQLLLTVESFPKGHRDAVDWLIRELKQSNFNRDSLFEVGERDGGSSDTAATNR